MENTQQPVVRRKRNQGQGLAEYSLILALVAVVCVSIIAVLGRGTKSTIYKVVCATGSKDPQCGCINEKLTVVGACVSTTLTATVTSSCTAAAAGGALGASLTVNGSSGQTPLSVTWSNAPVCTGGATSFNVQSSQPSPYNTSSSYSVSKP
ncbi:MAG: hypothetical protein H0X30_16800 [Anaerolineae bacterium]|nr:hypothetical protein [Anaerolineae bacterium]